MLTPTRFEKPRARHNTHSHKYYIQRLRTTLPTWGQDLLLHATEKPSTIPLYELLNQKHTTLLAVSDGGADVPKTTALSVGYLALNRKYYGNAKASHEAIQCNPTAGKGMVDSPYSRFLNITFSTYKHRTYASLPTAPTTVCSKTRTNFIALHPAGND
jgi:hypothetical protein